MMPKRISFLCTVLVILTLQCVHGEQWQGVLALQAADLPSSSSTQRPSNILELSAKQGTYNASSYLEILEDPTSRLTFADIYSGRYDTAFKKFTSPGDPSFGFTSSVFWARFHIRLPEHGSSTKPEWFLSNEYPLVDNIQLYTPVFSNDAPVQYDMQQSGDAFPFSMRAVEYRMPNFRLPEMYSRDSVCVCYVRLQTQSSMTFPLVIRSGSAMNSHISHEQFLLGIFYGILLIMFCYNLLMYLSLGDASFGYYVLYLVIYGTFLLIWNGLDFQYLWSDSPSWHNRSLPVMTALSAASVARFAQSYLNSSQYTPRLHRALDVLQVYCLLAVGLAFVFDYTVASKIVYVAILTGVPVAIAMAIIGIWKGYRPARYFFVAWVILLSSISMGVLRAFSLLPSGLLTMHGIQVGSAIEVLLLSLGLADRINIIRQEKKQAQEEMIEMLRNSEQELEQKVQQRTTELSDANEEIQRQIDVLAEQAREIELTNTMLQEKNVIIEQDRTSLARERERSERLLLSVLPAPIAERMKAGETRIAEHFSDVTVLFADVVGFTKLSSHVNPRELVELLDAVFTALDALAAKHGLEKIKTIGDAYMVVCGVPVPMEDHCERVARFAAEMQGVIDEVRSRWAVEGKELGTHAITMRVGIHIGEVIAGIIGSQKFTYDLWGDTVNTASRMESHGEPGKIHVSEEVFETLKEKFVFEERGEIEVKGKGAMRTWFLTDAKQTAPQAV
ncbi:MAG: adenylate/guanylate cyclase domain-containing protein [Candidatus Kapaibacteriota bacterium]